MRISDSIEFKRIIHLICYYFASISLLFIFMFCIKNKATKILAIPIKRHLLLRLDPFALSLVFLAFIYLVFNTNQHYLVAL